ncbi:MAG: OmpP1/FadL family transporter [Planctomycetota bacterium]|jgi:long-chain fatty acid transport protein
MRKFIILSLSLILVFSLSPAAFATNGTNLIGVGSISRSMGGVGIAAPQDAVNFDGTLFMPKVDAKITNEMTGNSSKESSDDKVYSIPAIGISSPINPKLRFGISAYGVSGLGVDYRGTDLSIPDAMGPGNDQKAEIATQLQVMKFAINLAYLVNDNLSLGLGIPVNYSALDLGAGTSFGYGVGAQLGLIWKAMDMISVGATYTTTQSVVLVMRT